MRIDAQRTVDPRDALDKARRYELWQHALKNGVADITHDMPAPIMRRILRERGLTQIAIPPRPLGQINQPHPSKAFVPGSGVVVNGDGRVQESDALADLQRQYELEKQERQQARVVKYAKPVSTINQLRRKCQELGIKMDRRDNLQSLQAKIDGHGKDAAQRSQ